jgi:hypothetical protein
VTIPAQDPHTQPLDVGLVVCTVRTSCGVPATCSPHHQRFDDDGLRRVDDTCGPVVFRDPHVPPSMWGDHGDAVGRRHMILGLPINDTSVSGMVSPGGWRDSIGAAISLRPPDVLIDQKDKKTTGIHSGRLTAHFDTCPEDAEAAVVERYARSCLWHMNDD